MIKEALQYIAGLKEEAMEPKIVDIGGVAYCEKKLIRYDREDLAEPIEASTLSALVDYIKNCGSEIRGGSIIHVRSPETVSLYSGLMMDRRREYLFQSTAIVPRFRFDEWYDQERFLIELQANFCVTPDLEAILKVAGNVEAKTTANYGDDGISQKTTIKQGIASKADVIVPNPVTLQPYRTFIEVEQPASEFVFRINDTGRGPEFKLIEAEGGLWRNEAMRNIKTYLENNLEEYISIDSMMVTIIA